ncbi:FeoA family protein [Lachnospiraceae bacterium 46-61]
MNTLQNSTNTVPCCIIEVKAEQKQKLRLYDMGFYVGGIVTPLYECLGGGTKVYEVKQTLIALRQQEAENIYVREVDEICSKKAMKS